MLRGEAKPGPVLRDAETPADRSGRVAAALRAGRRLAFPPPPPALGATATDEEARRARLAAEEDVLRGVRGVLAALATSAVVFVPDGATGWRALAEADSASRGVLGALRWPDFPGGDPLVVSPSRLPELRAALGAWLDEGVEQVALVPVLVGDELRAVSALGLTGTLRDDREWLQAAAAITGFGAAGIQALRLELRAQAEGRARDAYISLAAHELRSPLTSIKGYAQLLLRQARKYPIPETMRRSIEAIEQQSMRMSEMVGEMLDASRIRRGALEVMTSTTDLVPLARKVVERRAAFYPQHTINVESEEPALVGSYDAGRVEQVLRDLVDNAARHSPSGGTVELHLARDGANAVVTVRDRGIGVAPADRDRIFDYLYRSPISEQRNLSGLGLGLFVSRHLIERMGGRLTLDETSTAEPTGSVFRFTLPLA